MIYSDDVHIVCIAPCQWSCLPIKLLFYCSF